ncbi:hypothetical protein [Rheinheimera sp. 4Y26]|uniref:hypothetical protein n=1 Tax=Rheinheimera sp. 4Y26 TaxID=2977811 RepID=UPI0021B0B90A|nr:hypothetical protein [Rheinheimera sp. 4Y26]MCT6700985.1 hypothetical protein [Rheinheimera sp. 4Y26]
MRLNITLPTAAQCGRCFIWGMAGFWVLLLIFLLLPSEPVWLLQTVIVLWLVSFIITFGSYLLLLLRRIGILPMDE